MKSKLSAALLAGCSLWLITASPASAHDPKEHGKDAPQAAAASSDNATVKGEVIDLICYVDHGATGEKHAACAKTCIESGLPVGIKAEDGKTYVLVGDHKPMNSELAQYAAKTITVKGKVASRDGINLIENATIVK
jgi:hypothetical protein